MCGIWALFNAKGDYHKLRNTVRSLMKRIRHRGPDDTGLEYYESKSGRHNFIGHERLSIVDPLEGHQPIKTNDKMVCVAANCEIYNHIELRELVKSNNFTFHGHCDSQIIPALYGEVDIEKFFNLLSGKFGIVIYDHKKEKYYVGRDHIGILPVYIGRGEDGEFWVCSELKGIHDHALNVEILLPGIYILHRSLL
jgi:asparagine synthase (glutamine-hydrolysing)